MKLNKQFEKIELKKKIPTKKKIVLYVSSCIKMHKEKKIKWKFGFVMFNFLCTNV